ncbi:hypothetical protein GWI33_005146 [Rhynchophorus ferrugineus]|uniref:DUF4080 domain-containing protein n=1 Tax=Rhynchophorus ferrugineus TaxID=354439 RepID=A0A834IM24_RHYFE|nr:hypothetical protein GWI33_005146 [Rhynchophorus ferrugineus]
MIVCSKHNFGLTNIQARKLAYDYVVARKKTNIPDNWTKKTIASKDRIRGFLNRQSHLSIQTPEATSLSHATSFNKTNVDNFFENLKEVFDKSDIILARKLYIISTILIYRVDDCSAYNKSDCFKRPEKQVGQKTPADRGSLVTVCCGINGIGNTVPPYFIFPRLNLKHYMLHDASVGSDGSTHPPGWMTSSNFIKYMHHFTEHAKQTPENPV